MQRPNHYQDINLYVNNLDEAIDDESLRKEFSPFGTITSAKVMVKEGRSEGYGFVCYAFPEEAMKALEKMNGRTLGSKQIYVAFNRQHYTENRNLYVKNLDSSINDELLRKAFSPFGKVTSAKVMMERGISKKFGFVCFSSAEEAAKAVAEMHGRRILGAKELYVTIAQSKEDRKAQLTSQYMRRMTTLRAHQCSYFMPRPLIPATQRFYGNAHVMPPNYVTSGGTGCHCMCRHIPLPNMYRVPPKSPQQSAKIASTTPRQQSAKITSTSEQGGVTTPTKSNFKYASNVINVPQGSGSKETAARRIQQAVIDKQRRLGATGVPGATTKSQESGCGCASLYKRQGMK